MAVQGMKRLDTTRGLDLPGELVVDEIMSWAGRLFIQSRNHGLLVKEGDRYFTVVFEPWKAPKPKKAKASADEGAGPPDSKP